MAINNPFNAAGAKDIASLRRATTSAFGSLANQINSADFGSGTGGTSISLATNDRGETVIGDFVLGYQHRNLDTAYGSSSSGANFSATLAAVPGNSLWQGLRNTTDTTLSTTPGDFNWVEIELDAGAVPQPYSFTITGDVTVVSSGNLNLTNLLIDGWHLLSLTRSM